MISPRSVPTRSTDASFTGRFVAHESLILGAICLADMVSTAWLLQRGAAVEANAILRFYVELGIGWFIAAKTLLFVGPITVLELLRRRRPIFIARLLQTAIAGYVLVYVVMVARVNA